MIRFDVGRQIAQLGRTYRFPAESGITAEEALCAIIRGMQSLIALIPI